MRSGICPKCNSNNVHYKNKGIIYEMGRTWIWFVTGGLSHDASNLDSFVCVRCGYYENYVSDRAVLANIANTWEKIE